jgi:hypothetical protein
VADPEAAGPSEETVEVDPETLLRRRGEAARDLLVKTARQYGGVVTYAELANHVQQETGPTRQRPKHWIGAVLRVVAEQCSTLGEPVLTALCVDASGSVGRGYAEAVLAVHGVTPSDPDQHAAEERLRCYGFFGADLHPGGGFPSLTPRLTSARARQKKALLEARPLQLCPRCQLVVPPSGVCDNCD